MLTRFLAWIVRIVSIVAFVFGALVLIGDLILHETFANMNWIVGAIIMGVSLIVFNFARAKGEEKKAESTSKCKHCKQSIAGGDCYFKVDGTPSKNPYSGLMKVPVKIEITCPHCGTEKTIYDTVEVAILDEDNIREAVEDYVARYIK